jgi:hypothetical protein
MLLLAILVLAGAPAGAHGFGAEDVARLLARAPGEILVLRPDHGQASGS